MTGRLKEADERTKRELADKCQENGWLRRGRIPLARRPLPRGIPLRVREGRQRGRAARLLRARKLGAAPGDRVRGSRLRAAGRRRRRVVDAEAHRLRLARLRELSFGRIVQEPERFSHAIECMHRATPEQCKRLEYMEAVPSIEDAARRARDSIQQLNKTAMTPTRGARAELR